MSELIGKKVAYLDHGYVKLVDVMGDDELICSAARQSFDKSDEVKTDKQNQGLINYLLEHLHMSPFEMPRLVFEIKMPIFVMRQHVRHRVASLNETSLRYSEHDGDYYLPPVERFCGKHKWNKQGSGDPLPEHIAEVCQQMYREVCEKELDTYHKLVAAGVSNETARGVLNVSFYTKITWSMDLRNLLHYLRLRNDGHAQQEIHELAKIIEDEFVAKLFPKTYQAFTRFNRNSVSLDETEAEWMRRLVKSAVESGAVDMDAIQLTDFPSQRRWEQFLTKMGVTDGQE